MSAGPVGGFISAVNREVASRTDRQPLHVCAVSLCVLILGQVDAVAVYWPVVLNAVDHDHAGPHDRFPGQAHHVASNRDVTLGLERPKPVRGFEKKLALLRFDSYMAWRRSINANQGRLGEPQLVGGPSLATQFRKSGQRGLSS
jgi:hypothetical protein